MVYATEGNGHGPEPGAEATTALDRRDLKLLAQQMSKALRDSHGGGLMERFEAVSKLLFTKIVDEKRADSDWLGLARRPRELDVRPGDTERTIYERARRAWADTTTTLRDVFAGDRGQFPTDVSGVVRIVRLMNGLSLTSTSDDVKGSFYEELLRNTFEKNENQQYFTPRHVVEFMAALTAPSPGETVCDPACGSGGFLVGALDQVRAGDARASLQLRGAEVDDRMAWIARINLVMHGADPRAIHTLRGAGSLTPLGSIQEALPQASFDLILTNPPFGSDMTDRTALGALELGRGRTSRRRGVLFVERCIELLKPGGRLAIVLDDSVLNLSGNRDVRDYIFREAVVDAVISLPDVTFMPYSTAKSSILILHKRTSRDESQGDAFMADVEHVGVRPNGDPLYSDGVDKDGNRVLLSDLPEVLNQWRHYQDVRSLATSAATATPTVFASTVDADRPTDRRLDVFYYHPTRRHAEDTLQRATVPLVPLGQLVAVETASVNPAAEYGDTTIRWIGLGDIEAATGRYEVKSLPAERVKSASHVFVAGDILFSRLRPRLRKCVEIPGDDEGGVCSGELLVLRVRADQAGEVLRPYLAYMLRSDLIFGQLIYQVTGVGRPRVSAHAVRSVLLPLPDLAEQQRLVDLLYDADQRARTLRLEAAQRLVEADETIDVAYQDIESHLLARHRTSNP